jgi:copper chaperone CopZ
MIALASLLLSTPVHADALDIRISGMICGSCEQKITEQLDDLSFVESVTVSFDKKKACAEVNTAVDKDAVIRVIEELGYTVSTLDVTEKCDLPAVEAPQNWADKSGLDVQIISRGETVKLHDHRAGDKFTVYDFGAPWCSPCHGAEVLMKQYMSDHADVAVRAIVLGGSDARTSFALPVAKQHLSSAPGIPYFVVVAPNGKTIYRGVDLPKALKQIDKRR